MFSKAKFKLGDTVFKKEEVLDDCYTKGKHLEKLEVSEIVATKEEYKYTTHRGCSMNTYKEEELIKLEEIIPVVLQANNEKLTKLIAKVDSVRRARSYTQQIKEN